MSEFYLKPWQQARIVLTCALATTALGAGFYEGSLASAEGDPAHLRQARACLKTTQKLPAVTHVRFLPETCHNAESEAVSDQNFLDASPDSLAAVRLEANNDVQEDVSNPKAYARMNAEVGGLFGLLGGLELEFFWLLPRDRRRRLDRESRQQEFKL